LGYTQVAETLSAEVLEKMHAPPKDADVPLLSPPDLANADGFVFGFPTHFGMMCGQMKAFFDGTGSLWRKNALVRLQMVVAVTKIVLPSLYART
jgi:NAD(P)H dehydrogenase (quinone)